MRIATAEQMKNADQYAIHTLNIPSTQLMENASKAIAREALLLLERVKTKRAAVFCGSGNNGGDGLAAARRLAMAGVKTRAFLVGKREKMTEDAKEMERRFAEIGGVLEIYDPDDEQIKSWCTSADLILDAIFGIGLNSEIRGSAYAAVELMNNSGVPVIAADIASGVESDTGKILGIAAKCVKTVTFTLPKLGHFCGQGGLCCGALIIEDIGVPAAAVDREKYTSFTVMEGDVDTVIPRRRRDTHKGDYGKVCLICGSVGYTGAPTFAAKAAVRTGSGLVFLGVPGAIYPITAVKNDEAMVFPLPDNEDGILSAAAKRTILSRLSGCDACLIGPGLGRSEQLDHMLHTIMLQSKIPTVIDADGINALAKNIDILDQCDCPVILTPHEGEFKRLGGNCTSEDRVSSAKQFAFTHGCILVLKGYRTVTALPDGRVYINTTGNPGMAKGGSGDVLAGMITSLLGQGLAPEQAAFAAVWLHGRAGDLCAQALGEYAMTPSDLLEAIARVLKKY